MIWKENLVHKQYSVNSNFPKKVYRMTYKNILN